MKAISLVLLPGLDGTGKLFDPLISNLPDWIQPIVVSYPMDKPYGYDELKTIVSSAYPINKDFVILGESFSGPLAVMSAGEKPKGLKGIILCSSFVKKPFRLIPSWLSVFSVSPIYQLWPATIKLRSLFGRRKYKRLVEMAMDLRIDETKNIAYIKITGKVGSKDILDAFDLAVSSEKYKKGMGRLWDFTEIDLTSLESEVISAMAQYSLQFPAGVRDVKVAFVVNKSLEYGLVRMFQAYSDMYAKSQVMVFDTVNKAEEWMMEDKDT